MHARLSRLGGKKEKKKKKDWVGWESGREAHGGGDIKNPPASAGDRRESGPIPGSGRSPGEGNGNPLQYSCPENFHGLRSPVGYSPWGRKESDMTERLHFPAPGSMPGSLPHGVSEENAGTGVGFLEP